MILGTTNRPQDTFNPILVLFELPVMLVMVGHLFSSFNPILVLFEQIQCIFQREYF